MTVYVDDVRHPFKRLNRNYVMCHMWADSLPELLAMADRIGVARRYLQQPPKASWVHFDITLTKKRLAIRFGAVLTDKYGPVEHTARLAIAALGEDNPKAHYYRQQVLRIAQVRQQREPVRKASPSPDLFIVDDPANGR